MIRPATPADVPVILRFIRELAEYEGEPKVVLATEADLLRDGFGLARDGRTPLDPPSPPRFRALMAEDSSPAGNGPRRNSSPVGFALFFASYSTWLGHHGIRLEDLYVTPAARRNGIGRALLARLAQIAVEEGCGRLEWDVLTWNQSAIAVYEHVGAVTQSEWRIMRLSGEALQQLAAEAATCAG